MVSVSSSSDFDNDIKSTVADRMVSILTLADITTDVTTYSDETATGISTDNKATFTIDIESLSSDNETLQTIALKDSSGSKTVTLADLNTSLGNNAGDSLKIIVTLRTTGVVWS